jgi:hypothetical protein
MTTVTKTKTKKKAKRYDDAEKTKFLNEYQELRNKGKNADAAAKEVGVPYITLRTWQKAKEVKPKAKKRGRPAKVAVRGAKPKKKTKITRRAPSSAAVVLVLNDGTRVECASAKDAVAFIRANK